MKMSQHQDRHGTVILRKCGRLQLSSLLDCSLVCVHVCVPHQQKAWTDGYPADSPETTRVETKHDLNVITETVGT